MFETRPIEDLIKIASSGGGIETRVAVRPTPDLVRLAAAAAAGGARVYLRGLATRPTADLVQIAAAGRGHVVFADKLPDD